MIYLLCEIKEEFTKYANGDTKLVIVHINLFKLILKKYIFRKKQENAQLLLDNIQKKYNVDVAQVPMARSSSRSSMRPGRR